LKKLKELLGMLWGPTKIHDFSGDLLPVTQKVFTESTFRKEPGTCKPGKFKTANGKNSNANRC